MNLTIELTEDEQRAVNSYANFYGVSISDAFKNALLDLIEDEIDSLELAKMAENRENEEVYSHEEVEKILFGDRYDV